MTAPNQPAASETCGATGYEPYVATAREYVERWDKGDSVWTFEMGGLGPGYEQAIQVLVVELCRDNLDRPLPDKGDEAWRAWGDDTVMRINKDVGGFSGAQVGAAISLAVKYLTEGPRTFFARAKAEGGEEASARMIQVSNAWPRVERSA